MLDLLIFDPMVNGLLLIYDFLFHDFALAIIIFTILIRLITLPLTLQQQRSTQRMQELQGSKRWQDMQKKHKGDRQKLQEEQLKLYREVGFNPLSGCLPLLIQFPILIGLYQSISRALALAPPQLFDLTKRIYPFISSSLIPVDSSFLWWDLGQPERVISPQVLGFGLPVLTILVVLTSWVQTKLTTPPSADSQSRQMSTMMSLYLPLLIGYFSYSYAAGLALYFLVSNILTVVQYAAMGKVNWRGLLSLRGNA
jgi:YidC/Oxa1 family membrane protein insertase